jgi:hypothetical protein
MYIKLTEDVERHAPSLAEVDEWRCGTSEEDAKARVPAARGRSPVVEISWKMPPSRRAVSVMVGHMPSKRPA